MNKIYYLAIAAMCALSSCGGDDGKLKVEDTTIAGGLGDYFEVVDKPYVLEGNKGDELKVEMRCKQPINDKQQASLGIVVMDKDGNTLYSKNASQYWSEYGLHQVNEGESYTQSFYLDLARDAKPAKFRITSNFRDESETSSSSSSYSYSSYSSDDDVEVATSSDDNWDSVLDSYEEFVDNYIRLFKKAQAGDMSAMGEYATYMEKAQNLSDKLSSAKGSLSPSQVARYTKIMNKMATAAQ